MKKNKMMRLASGLLVAVLITTSTISGTYAKYTTAGTATDEARVAKWGVTVVANGTLYGEKYADDTSKITASDDEDVISVYGKQAAKNNVVAPGTMSDEGFHFAINGKPEVDSKVTVDMSYQNIFLAKGKYGVMVPVEGVTAENFGDVGNVFYTFDNGTKEYAKADAYADATPYFELHDAAEVTNTNGYWPVVYSMAGETVYTAGTVSDDSLKAVADLIADKISTTVDPVQHATNKSQWTYTDIVRNIEQNKDIAAEEMNLGNIGISWAWEFDYDGAGTYDAQDTILGNLMAERIGGGDWKGDVVKYKDATTYEQLTEGTDYCLDTNFTIDITVEQVD